jgi:DNA repair ATPase RecN
MNKNVMAKVAKINKEGLSAQKVELNVQSDVNKVLDELQDALDLLNSYDNKLDDAGMDLRRAREKFEDLERDIKQDAKNAQGDVQQAQSIKAKVEKAAKELGVDPKSVKGYKI